MNAPVRVALVGMSGYGAFYLDTLLDDVRADGRIRLVGAVDPLPGRCSRLEELRRRGIALHSTLGSLFDDEVPDLLAIAAPTHLHARMTCAALARGVNVLCEKPLAGSLADALLVADVQRTAPSFAAIGYQWSFSAAVQHLKRDVMSGALGRAVRMRSIASYPRGHAYYARNDWAGRIVTAGGDRVMDSPVNNATAHFLHNMLYVLGPTRETSATPFTVQAELYRANDIDNYDTAALRCETTDGVEVLFYTTHAEARPIGPAFTLEFTRATVTYDARAGGSFTARFADGRLKDYGNPDEDRCQPLWQCVDAVRSGGRIACGIEAAMAQTICMTAAQRSPIIDFPSELRRTVRGADGSMSAIDGLGDALTRSYDAARLPSELGDLAWSRGALVIDAGRRSAQSPRSAAAALFVNDRLDTPAVISG